MRIGQVRKILGRLIAFPISLFVVVSVAFALVILMPGDPAVTIAGDFASPEALQTIREALGTDKPFLVRYLDYMGGVFTGDLGTSFRSMQPVAGELFRYLPNTIELVVAGMMIAVFVGVSIGTVGAYFRDRIPDRLAKSTVTVIQSVPVFVTGLMLILIFFYLLGWLPPPVGRLGLSDFAPPSVTGFLLIDCVIAGKWETLASALAHMVMPAIALGVTYSAYFAKTTRATMADAMFSQGIEFARACGLKERTVVRYALLRSRTSIMTYGAILVGQLVGGATVVELIFSWQGIGLWGLKGILNVDVPVIQSFVLAAGVFTLLAYFLLDLLTVALDPRLSDD